MKSIAEPKKVEKRMNILTAIITVIVLLVVGAMRQYKIETGIDFSFLAPFHASVNAVTAIVLIYAYIQIRRLNVERHRKAIYTALFLSAIFLISYVIYHFTTEETHYGGEGWMRYVYFFLLISHVVLAGGILPFILLTFTRAYTGQFARHRKMARWVFPLWLYVVITGPICYLMLMPYY